MLDAFDGIREGDAERVEQRPPRAISMLRDLLAGTETSKIAIATATKKRRQARWSAGAVRTRRSDMLDRNIMWARQSFSKFVQTLDRAGTRGTGERHIWGWKSPRVMGRRLLREDRARF